MYFFICQILTFSYFFDNIKWNLSSLTQILKDFGGFIVKKIFMFIFTISLFFGICAFGTNAQTLPQPLRGMDVSKWNGDIVWVTVKNSGAIDFAILRTSYGWSNREKQTDRKLRRNIDGAKSVGIPIGAYHYSYATNPTEAIWEADFFIDRLKWTQWEYPAYIDLEDKCQLKLSNEQRTDIAVTFMERVKSAGYCPGIYSNLDWTRNKLNMDRLAGYELWIAQWNTHCSCERPYGIWQHTSSGSVPGINGRVDLDFAYKDYPSYMRNNHLNGF